MRFTVVLIILSLLLSNCAGLSPEKINSLPENTNILIVSAIGNTLDVYEYSTLKGNKLLDSLNVEFWGLNPIFENHIYNAL